MTRDIRAQGGLECEAGRWARTAVRACLAVWCRTGRRYARRVARQHLLRDPVPDLMTLAARGIVPLQQRRVRPLPHLELDPWRRAFNGLDPADRVALLGGGTRCASQSAHADHLASAFERLLEAAARPVIRDQISELSSISSMK